MDILIDRSYRYCTVLTLNRPDKRNALSIKLMQELCEAIEEVQNLPEQRVIIIKGAGSVFCAGLDLLEAADMSSEEQSSESIGRVLKAIYTCPLVTIAAVHGAVLAGGGGILAACDLAIAESGTIFGFPETRRGLVAAQIMPFLLRLLPKRILNQLIFLGETINIQRAYEVGLINEIAESSAFTEALRFVESISQGAPQATASAKKFMQQLELVNFNEGLKLGFELHRKMRQGNESKEGIQAFLEKRSPNWDKH